MSEFTDKLTKHLLEDVLFNEDGDMLKTFPYVEKLSSFLGLEDAADLYNFFDSALEYEDKESMERNKSLMNDWEYDIYTLIFDKFGKYESDFTDEDCRQFGSSMIEYNQFHDSLKK